MRQCIATRLDKKQCTKHSAMYKVSDQSGKPFYLCPQHFSIFIKKGYVYTVEGRKHGNT